MGSSASSSSSSAVGRDYYLERLGWAISTLQLLETALGGADESGGGTAAMMMDASYASPTVAELIRACCECSLPPEIGRGMAKAVHEAALKPYFTCELLARVKR